jgi:PTH2 family peptidyl-tRNA hydrolase
MAQAGHAAAGWLAARIVQIVDYTEANVMSPIPLAYFTNAEMEWMRGAFTKIVLKIDSEAELHEIVAKAKAAHLLTVLITDAGNTEFGGVPTVTCCAIGPAEAAEIDAVTGHLKTL